MSGVIAVLGAKMKVSSQVFALAIVAMTLQGCGESSTSDANPTTDPTVTDSTDTSDPSDPTGEETPFLNQVLSDIGNNVILPTYASFEGSASSLVTALSDYQLLLETDSASGEELASVQAQWVETMVAWQAAEVLQLGPAAPVGALEPAVGAMGLRDEIYSWPTVNQCRVDQELVEAKFGDATFFEQELNNVYGLDASEYLLFGTGTGNVPAASFNKLQGLWDELSEEDLVQSRVAYSLALASNVLSRADELHAAWAVDEGNFVADFTQTRVWATACTVLRKKR